jgi:hypothetical protein
VVLVATSAAARKRDSSASTTRSATFSRLRGRLSDDFGDVMDPFWQAATEGAKQPAMAPGLGWSLVFIPGKFENTFQEASAAGDCPVASDSG